VLAVSVRVSCPHCHTPCLVAQQHLGVPVQCGRCGKSFTTRGESAAPPHRLDIAVASQPGHELSEHNFLVQHLVCSNRDQHQELALLALAPGPVLGTIASAQASWLGDCLRGTAGDAAGAVEAILLALREARQDTAGVSLEVIAAGQERCSLANHHGLYLQRASQLVQVNQTVSSRLKLAAGDGLFLASTRLDERDLPGIQAELGSSEDARRAAPKLVECLGRRGRNHVLVIAVRCS
jgi:predicted Zn finger-like uncharacterized protein